jgi:dipeptidyl aminopeptidase/acylaminoacyl peptidase
MHARLLSVPRRTTFVIGLLAAGSLAGLAAPVAGQQPSALRPMTFLDMQQMRQTGSPTPSPDGKWLLYTLNSPDWKEGTKQTDLYLVSLQQGVTSTRQLTFTNGHNETSPRWAADGSFFVFLSNRDAPEDKKTRNQLYMMRPDGGEALRLTDEKEGVSDAAFTRDGRWLAYRAGKEGEEQLYRLSGAHPGSAPAEQITRHPTGVRSWHWAPDGTRIYFVTPDAVDPDEKTRREKKFTVNIRNPETPVASLWALNIAAAPSPAPDAHRTRRLTEGAAYSVDDVTISKDGKWVGFRGLSPNRYQRGITQENLYSDLYLLEVATGAIERLTSNIEVGESNLSFSPDSQSVAFSGPDDLVAYGMSNSRVYVRAIGERGRPFRKLGTTFDGDVTVGFWAKDGSTIYFNEGVKATNQIVALDVKFNTVRPITEERASVSAQQDADTGVLLIDYADGTTPPTLFTVDSMASAPTRTSWRQLTDPNPQVRGFALGQQEEITWTSRDGTRVGGVLVKPVGFREGQRYPLIVAIHGGPASADVLSFNGGYGSQVYAGAGYVVLRPNYRGSTNYGNKLQTDIVGNYMAPGYDDIMAGVDHLIAQGIADPDRMGALGWSAGGHWSNWILTHTDRFKAISTGAGTANWISMYAQSDVQRNRQFYLGNKLPYDDFDAYWNQSPLKFIKNAKTPTMIHVVEGDPRVPSPQSIELHMALKQLGVPTELFMYPGTTHGIPDPRNQLVKSVSEMAWMDRYVRGMDAKFTWRDVLKTLEDEAASSQETARPH